MWNLDYKTCGIFFRLRLVNVLRFQVIDSCESVFFEVIFKRHPENAILSTVVIKFLSEFFGPFGRFIRPVSIPLHWAPRISELNYFFSIDLSDIKDRVSMSQNQTFGCGAFLPAFNFLLRLFAVVSSSRHDKLVFIGSKKLFPQGLLLDLTVIKKLAWATSKIADGLRGVTPNDVFEATVSFGISFFQKNDPKFALSTASKMRLVALRINNDVSIDFIEFPGSINAEPNQEIPSFNISILKKSLN